MAEQTTTVTTTETPAETQVITAIQSAMKLANTLQPALATKITARLQAAISTIRNANLPTPVEATTTAKPIAPVSQVPAMQAPSTKPPCKNCSRAVNPNRPAS